MQSLRRHFQALGVTLCFLICGTHGQAYPSGGQIYNNYYYPTPAPASTAVLTVPAATTTSKPATRTPVPNSNTAPGGAPSNSIYGTNGTVCDTRTAFAAIGCPCMLVNKACADPNSLCTAISSTSGRKKRFSQRGRKGSPMGNAASNRCVCKSGYKYDSNSNTCIFDCSQQFCSASPTEAAFFQGPTVAPLQTYLLFSGSCVLEYKEDYAAHKMIVTLAPRPISSYIGQASFKGPVTLAYDTLQNTDSNYVLNLVDSSGSLVSCTTNPNADTKGLTCAAPVASGGTTQLAKASSASSQFDNGVGAVDQFVVVPTANKELAMYDQNFGGTPSPFSKSTNFLSGQTHITTITAIQVLEDKSGINNGVLAVYGTDAAGVPYLGYVSQGGTAGQSEFPAVSTNPVFPATTWIADSQPLKSQFQGLLTC